MDRKTATYRYDEDRCYVESIDLIIPALEEVYASHKYSLVQDHKEMCKLILNDINNLKNKKIFIKDMNNAI